MTDATAAHPVSTDTLTIRTARLGDYDGDDRLDVTRKGADGWPDGPGVAFAPSWPLLRPHLDARAAGKLTVTGWLAYAEAYRAEMRVSWAQQRDAWLRTLTLPQVTLLCYCADPVHCHRRLLVELLARAGARVGRRTAGAGEVLRDWPPRRLGIVPALPMVVPAVDGVAQYAPTTEGRELHRVRWLGDMTIAAAAEAIGVSADDLVALEEGQAVFADPRAWAYAMEQVRLVDSTPPPGRRRRGKRAAP